MRFFGKDELIAKAGYRDIVEALRTAFAADIVAPARHHHSIDRGARSAATFLLMPAWTGAAANKRPAYVGLKTVMVVPDNPQHGRPTIQANYLLTSAESGETLALMDGTEITVRRTAAASALAADYLARNDSTALLMVGAGALGPHVVRAHASVRPITRVMIWNRSQIKAEAMAEQLSAEGFKTECPTSLAEASSRADIISCATTSTVPIIEGKWVKPGTHIDLMGAFKPAMRETDGETVQKARVFVDTYEGAMSEAGDLLLAIEEGFFAEERIVGDLAQLCRGEVRGRGGRDEITLFKSCGTALEDLATAILIFEKP